MSPRSPVNGVLLLDKPRGLTSQQAVSRVKRLLNAAKAGHTGTLDPMAEGLLPIGLGEATKYTRFLLDADKTYRASLRLGVTTTTGDAEGEILLQRPVAVDAAAVAAILPRFLGEQQQMPPMHSALKVDGRPLYSYARAGVTLERQSRTIRIDSLQAIDFKEEILTIRVSCSKGTYIRVLAEDMGEALGCGAHLVALIREASGGYELSQAISLQTLEAMSLEDRLQRLLPSDAFAAALQPCILDDADAVRIGRGQMAMITPNPGFYRLYGAHGRFLGVGEASAEGLRAVRLMATDEAAKQENPLSNPQLNG